MVLRLRQLPFRRPVLLRERPYLGGCGNCLRAGVAVQKSQLFRGIQKCLVVVLPVDIEQPRRDLLHDRRVDRLAVDAADAPPRVGDPPGDHKRILRRKIVLLQKIPHGLVVVKEKLRERVVPVTAEQILGNLSSEGCVDGP